MKGNRISVQNILLFLSFVGIALYSSSCSKDPVRQVINNPGDTTTHPVTYDNGVFVINEGNFRWDNASVTYIDSKTNDVVQDLFQKANNRKLGDVAESMKISGNLGYVVINNSNCIEVVSLKDFKSVATINGLNSPRFIEIVDANKAYVTNLQKNISIIDLRTNTVSGSINIKGWTENLIRYGKFMLVTSIGTMSEPSSGRRAQILMIDTQTDKLVDSIQTGKEPIGLVIDKKQKVWVLCSGGYDFFESPSLIRINPELRMIEKTFTFSGTAEVPSKLCINGSGDTIYFLKNGVHQMPVTSAALPAKPLISTAGRLLYGLAIQPSSGQIFVSDAKDYVQNGTVYQYDATGRLIRQSPAGRIPGAFCFTAPGAR